MESNTEGSGATAPEAPPVPEQPVIPAPSPDLASPVVAGAPSVSPALTPEQKASLQAGQPEPNKGSFLDKIFGFLKPSKPAV